MAQISRIKRKMNNKLLSQSTIKHFLLTVVALEWLEPSVSVNLIDDDTVSCLQLPLQLSRPSNAGKLRMTSSRGVMDAVTIKLTSQVSDEW